MDERRRRCATVLATVYQARGYLPAYTYPVLLDLGRPWVLGLPLLDIEGNIGTPDGDPAADAEWTGCRLSAAGAVAAAAESSHGPPVPLDLVNGTTHAGGFQPPFAPHAVAAALLQAIQQPKAGDAELAETLGPPVFATGCQVRGDVDGLYAGDACQLRLSARVGIGRGSVELTHLPPGCDSWGLTDSLNGLRREHRALLASVDGPYDGRVVCTLAAGADPTQVAALVEEVPEAHRDLTVQLPAPIAVLLRDWVDTHGAEAVAAGAHLLEGIRHPPAGPRAARTTRQ